MIIDSQMIGRVLRPAPGKVDLIIDHVYTFTDGKVK
jgi:superfamily II DNA or RNA helicase